MYSAQSFEVPLFLPCSAVLGSRLCFADNFALPCRRNTCKIWRLPISTWQFSKVIFTYASVDSALEQRLCSRRLGWKHGKMQAGVCLCASACILQFLWASLCVAGVRVEEGASVYSTDKLLDSLYITTPRAKICLADGYSDY